MRNSFMHNAYAQQFRAFFGMKMLLNATVYGEQFLGLSVVTCGVVTCVVL